MQLTGAGFFLRLSTESSQVPGEKVREVKE